MARRTGILRLETDNFLTGERMLAWMVGGTYRVGIYWRKREARQGAPPSLSDFVEDRSSCPPLSDYHFVAVSNSRDRVEFLKRLILFFQGRARQ